MRKVATLGETLGQLAHAGLDDFYRGDVAREIAGDLERIGAPVTRADLKAYRAAWRQPLSLPIAGATLYNTPPPTQGLASLILMGLFERLDVRNIESFAYFHGLDRSLQTRAVDPRPRRHRFQPARIRLRRFPEPRSAGSRGGRDQHDPRRGTGR